MQQDSKQFTKTIPRDALDVLRRCSVVGNKLYLPDGQLPRPLYESVNKVLVALGGKWVRSAKAHVFPTDAGDKVATAVLAGAVVDEKKLYQFFETPDSVADLLVSMANIGKSDRVLEPSAGAGAIVRAIHRRYPAMVVDVCELEQSRYEALHKSPVVKGRGQDFLEIPATPYYDRVVANPPFRNGQDVEHVMRMLSVCAPGGRVVSVMSPAWEYRAERKFAEFRRLMNQGHPDVADATAERLPDGSFSMSGTQVNTVVVVIDKRK